MLDRIAQAAVLVGDQPEQVLGYRQVRLRFEDAPAHRLGLDEPVLGAAALDVHERIVDRHEAGVGWRGKLVHRGSIPCGCAGGQEAAGPAWGWPQAVPAAWGSGNGTRSKHNCTYLKDKRLG